MRRFAVFLSFCLFWTHISVLQAATFCIPKPDLQDLTIIHDKTSGDGKGDGEGGEQPKPEPEPEPEPDCD